MIMLQGPNTQLAPSYPIPFIFVLSRIKGQTPDIAPNRLTPVLVIAGHYMHPQAPEQLLRTNLSSPAAPIFLYNTPSDIKPTLLTRPIGCPLPKSRSAPPHDIPLTHQFRIEFATVKRQVDIEVDTVKCSLRRIHPLEVLLQILPRQVRG